MKEVFNAMDKSQEAYLQELGRTGDANEVLKGCNWPLVTGIYPQLTQVVGGKMAEAGLIDVPLDGQFRRREIKAGQAKMAGLNKALPFQKVEVAATLMELIATQIRESISKKDQGKEKFSVAIGEDRIPGTVDEHIWAFRMVSSFTKQFYETSIKSFNTIPNEQDFTSLMENKETKIKFADLKANVIQTAKGKAKLLDLLLSLKIHERMPLLQKAKKSDKVPTSLTELIDAAREGQNAFTLRRYFTKFAPVTTGAVKVKCMANERVLTKLFENAPFGFVYDYDIAKRRIENTKEFKELLEAYHMVMKSYDAKAPDSVEPMFNEGVKFFANVKFFSRQKDDEDIVTAGLQEEVGAEEILVDYLKLVSKLEEGKANKMARAELQKLQTTLEELRDKYKPKEIAEPNKGAKKAEEQGDGVADTE